MYTMLSVVLGLPPRCHRCKVRGHLAYQCVACRYCGSGSHTSEEHSIENAKRRSFREVVGGTQQQYECDMEDESAEVRGEVENLVNDSEPGPLTQMLQDSQGAGGGDVLNEGNKEEGVGDNVGEVEVVGLGEGKGRQWRGSCQRKGHSVGKVGKIVLRKKKEVGNRKGKGGGKSKGGEGGRGGEQSGGNRRTVILGRMGWVDPVLPLGSGVPGGFRL